MFTIYMLDITRWCSTKMAKIKTKASEKEHTESLPLPLSVSTISNLDLVLVLFGLGTSRRHVENETLIISDFGTFRTFFFIQWCVGLRYVAFTRFATAISNIFQWQSELRVRGRRARMTSARLNFTPLENCWVGKNYGAILSYRFPAWWMNYRIENEFAKPFTVVSVVFSLLGSNDSTQSQWINAPLCRPDDFPIWYFIRVHTMCHRVFFFFFFLIIVPASNNSQSNFLNFQYENWFLCACS